MPQMSQVLRERAIGMLAAGMSTRAVARELNVHFSTISRGREMTPPPSPDTVKLHILEWPFIVASLRHTCAIIMLSNQHLDMPHL